MFEALSTKRRAVVFGSINIDLVAKTPRLPVPGETLRGHNFVTVPGGKGANQAVAIARLGIQTQIVGRVGGDSFGKQLIESLQTAGVETDFVFVDETASSGVAAIAVDDAGENQIIIIPGANGHVDTADVKRLQPLLPGATALLLQLEIPMDTVLSAAQAAKNVGVPVILDPAPVLGEISQDLYSCVDIITPNEIEAGQLVGFTVDNLDTATKAADTLLQRGVGTALVKLGAKGVFCATPKETFLIPAFSVAAVDTVAAGDAFNGGLAVAIAEGLALKQAIVWGAAAGAIAATQAGAQASMPHRNTFNTFLKNQGISF